nr:uncharacterized protein LOC107129762 [Macaca fascicularis]
MVGGLTGERRLHRDRARDAAGTRLPGPAANPRRGRRRGAEGRGARRNQAREVSQETLFAAPLGISPPCLRRSRRANPPPPRRRCLRLFLLLRPVPLWPPRVAAPRLPEPPPSGLGSGKLRRGLGSGGPLICMRLACARPPHLHTHSSRRIPELNPAAAGAAAPARVHCSSGAAAPGGRGAGEGMCGPLPSLDPR